MELFCQFTDMILAVNPKIAGQKEAKPILGRVVALSIQGEE